MPENKEILNSYPEAKVDKSVMVDMTDVEVRIPKEIESWMDKVESGTTALKTVADATGTAILTPSTPSVTKIKLPTTRKVFLHGFKLGVDMAGKWLSTFVLKLIKMKEGKAEFKKEE